MLQTVASPKNITSVYFRLSFVLKVRLKKSLTSSTEFKFHIDYTVIGTTQNTKEELVIRACSLENMDNQCGVFKFQDEFLDGCILTCNKDGCNAGEVVQLSHWSFVLCTLITSLLSVATIRFAC